jgi:DNA invertase Pin-like site-specific DNA recombinase
VAVLTLAQVAAKVASARGVGLHVTEQGIDTTTAEGHAMFGMLSVLAELPRELTVANTRDGLAAARARGRTGGRRPRLNAGQVALAQELYDAGDHTVYGHLDDASKAIGRPFTANR